jgi:hypothetical protein
MLFDLRGKRRRVVQVTYAILAALFLVSFVGFGIGSDAAGGIFDALGVGGGSSGQATNPQFESQIEEAEARLAENPKDEDALRRLAETRYQAGQAEVESDPETGAPVFTDSAQDQFQLSVDAWERYLEVDPKRVNSGLALQLLGAYQALLQTDTEPESVGAHLEGAKDAAAIAARQQPSANAYGTLAQFAYFSGDVEQGDEAASKALAEAEGSERNSLRRTLEGYERQGRKIQESLKAQAAGKEELENPLGGAPGATPAP